MYDDTVGLESWPKVGEGLPEKLYGTAGNVFCPTQHHLRQYDRKEIEWYMGAGSAGNKKRTKIVTENFPG